MLESPEKGRKFFQRSHVRSASTCYSTFSIFILKQLTYKNEKLRRGCNGLASNDCGRIGYET